MSEDTLALSGISTFGPQGHVSPFDQLITLTFGQLEALISEAVARAQAPLLEDILALRASQEDAEAGILGLVARVDSLQEATARERAYDRKRIARLENPDQETTKTERDRLARIEKYLREAPNHMITLAELRGRLGIGKQRLSMLIRKLDEDRYYLKMSAKDKRVRYLCLRPILDSSRRTITNFDI